MLLLGTALTVATVVSTWVATTQVGRLRPALRVWGDSISPLFLNPWGTLQEWESTAFNSSHPPHPDNCSTCLFASGKDGSPVLVGQKLPHTNYSHIKLLLLSEDSRTVVMDPSHSKHAFRWFWSQLRNVSAVALLVMLAWISISPLGSRLRHYHPVMNETTMADGTSTIDDKRNNMVVDAHVDYEPKKTSLVWLAASLFRGRQSERCPNAWWEQHSDKKRLDEPFVTKNGTVEGESRDIDESGSSTARMDEDETLEEDHERNVLDLENKIEQRLTDAALEQKRIALIKEKDLEIESLRKKLDFTTGKFRDFQKEHEECRTGNALHKTN